jgi:hypothetical protein
VLLVTLPPLVVTTIFPVAAPVGTVAVTSVSELTVKLADFPSKVTLVDCTSPVPIIVTLVPTGPLSGLNVIAPGVMRNMVGLVSVVEPVVTVIDPVSAPAGTAASTNAASEPSTFAWIPPNFTTDEPASTQNNTGMPV